MSMYVVNHFARLARSLYLKVHLDSANLSVFF